MWNLRPLILAVLVITLATSLSGQSLRTVIPLTDNIPTTSDHPYGITMDPDGHHAYVAICGALPPFSAPLSQWPTYNNRVLAKVDVETGLTVASATVGDYPEEIALTQGSLGSTRHVYVTNGTSGTVTCLSPTLTPVATISLSPCFGGAYASIYPFSILASPDGNRVYVQGTSCGTLDVINSDPMSPAFNTVIQSHSIPMATGRMSWLVPGQILVTPITEYLNMSGGAFSDGSQTGIALVDVNTGAVTPHYVVPYTQFAFPSITDSAVSNNGTVIATVGFGNDPLILEIDPWAGAVVTMNNLVGQVGTTLHGLALSPDGTQGVATSLTNNMELIFFDPATLMVQSIHPTFAIPATLPNEVVFTRDGGRIVVTLQGLEEARVYGNLPGAKLHIQAPQWALVGGPLPILISGVEAGEAVALFTSLGGGPQILASQQVYLSNPFFPVHFDVGDLVGASLFSGTVPNHGSFSGVTLYFQAGCTDQSGRIRLSEGRSVSIL